ncbi:hypothetical protein GGR50DRAFT_694566 [Xylaria sp. CBS 124048]|nr:hypothetical protein GGR50DRAFT_694566 [Xylaria sp. CBS 124048]
MSDRALMSPGARLRASNDSAWPVNDADKPESRLQQPTERNDLNQDALEPGEIGPRRLKKEEREENPYLKYQHVSRALRQDNDDRSQFTQVATTVGPAPRGDRPWRSMGSPHFGGIESRSAVQRRNQARLASIVTRLQNYDGSVTDLLAIANIQQQLDVAFADLDRAQDQLKQILAECEREGCITNRNSQARNVAAKGLNTASQRILQLSKELCKKIPHVN